MPPATATIAVPLAYGAPHANGPTNSGTHAHVLSRPQHRHGHSADYHDPRVAQKAQHAQARLSSQALSKPLPTKPDISGPYQPTEAQRYKQQSLQKLTGREQQPRHGDPPALAAPQSSSLGRSATAADGRPSSASHPRRKPVTSQMNEGDVQQHFQWTPGSEPQVIQTPTTEGPSGSSRSRNRQMALYRDPPSQHQPDTWSKATAQQKLDSRASSSRTLVQGHHHSKSTGSADHFVISSASLGRHHSASASVPSATLPGSAHTIQGVFPVTPTAANPHPSQRVYTSTSAVPTPQAVVFPVSSSKHERHASTSSQADWNAERQRKLSHHRNASASTQDVSPSSCSTGSSHCDTWNSHTSQPDQPQQQSQSRRARGISDAPAPSTHYLGPVMSRPSQTSVVKLGSGGDEERGRKKDKDDSFMGRVRARSNSLTKSLSKAIQYPVHLVKGKKENRKSHQNLGQGGSMMLSGSDAGHSSHSQAYPPSTSTTSTHASPVSHRSRSHSHSVQARPPKKISRREQQETEYSASPMTKAKNVVLHDWDDVDMPPRIDSFYMPPPKIAVYQTQHREGDRTPVHRSRAPQVIPMMEAPYSRRR